MKPRHAAGSPSRSSGSSRRRTIRLTGRGVRPRPAAGPGAGRLRRGHRGHARGGHEHPALSGGHRRDLVRRGASARPGPPRHRGRDRHVPQRRGLRGRAPARVGRLQLARAGRLAPGFHDQWHVLGPRGGAADRLRGRPRGPGASRPPRDRRPVGAVPRGQAATAPRGADGGAVPAGDRAGHRLGGPGDGARGRRRLGRADRAGAAADARPSVAGPGDGAGLRPGGPRPPWSRRPCP